MENPELDQSKIGEINKSKESDMRIPEEYREVANKWIGDQQAVNILFTLAGLAKGNDFLIGNQTRVTYTGDQKQETVEQSSEEDYQKLTAMLQALGLQATYVIDPDNLKLARIYYARTPDDLVEVQNIFSMPSGTKAAWDKFGEVYGFPRTAIEAFPDQLATESDLPEEIRTSRFYTQVLPFRLSKNHYQEEWTTFLKNFKMITQRYPHLVKDFTKLKQDINWYNQEPTSMKF